MQKVGMTRMGSTNKCSYMTTMVLVLLKLINLDRNQDMVKLL